jgi:hypothetical protein
MRIDEKQGPCDVWVPGSSFGASRLTGTEAAEWLKKHATGKQFRLTVRPWQADDADHNALRDFQVEMIKGGRGLMPI